MRIEGWWPRGGCERKCFLRNDCENRKVTREMLPRRGCGREVGTHGSGRSSEPENTILKTGNILDYELTKAATLRWLQKTLQYQKSGIRVQTFQESWKLLGPDLLPALFGTLFRTLFGALFGILFWDTFRDTFSGNSNLSCVSQCRGPCWGWGYWWGMGRLLSNSALSRWHWASAKRAGVNWSSGEKLQPNSTQADKIVNMRESNKRQQGKGNN